jgi:PAS domain S-box-containing protein
LSSAWIFILQRTASHPLFLFPAALLLLSVVLFGFIEYRMERSSDTISEIVNDPELALASRIQDGVWMFRERLENYATLGKTPENYQAAQTALKELRVAVAEMDAFLNHSEEEAAGHQIDIRVLRTLQKNLETIIPVIQDESRLMETPYFGELRKTISAIADDGHALSRSISATRQAEFAHFTDQIAHDEHGRTWLLILDIACVVVLIGSLFRNVLRFKRNAEMAWAAERYNAFYAAALQSIRVGVLIRDMQRKGTPVLFVNHAFTELTGYDLAYMADKKSDILFGWHTEQTTAEAFRTAIAQEQARNFDVLIYRKNGSSLWCDWHISPVHDKEGRLTHYISLLTDITSMRQTQEALLLAKEQAEHASAVKTSFLATMSHEIRTPINGLLGVLDILSETDLSPEQKHYLQIAVNSSQSLHAIINDILDYSKMESGKIELSNEPFALSELTQSIVDLADPVALRKGIALRLAILDKTPERLEGDPGKIRQVILNLVMNAIKFTDAGYVELRIEPLLIQEKSGRNVALMRFEVTDTGIGISATDQDKLFKEFSQVERSFTRRFGGTGLGLAISKRLVTMMGGEIGVESKPGQGSKFWFMLPILLGAACGRNETVKNVAAGAYRGGIGRPVLLVEDNETNQLVASRYLQKAGLHPDVVDSGAAAIEACAKKTYDLIFMDISMSDMDGFETTRRLRAQEGWLAKAPIIALTAHVMPGDRERCLAAGMNDHLEKPLNYPVLVRMLNRWMPSSDEATPGEEAAAAAPAVASAATSPEMLKPAFDPAVLQRLCDDLGAEAVVKITDLFLMDSARRLDDLLAPATRQSVTLLGDAAHTLKSSSASCGLAAFAARMAAIEAACKEGKEDRAASLLTDVTMLYHDGCAALKLGVAIYRPKPRV